MNSGEAAVVLVHGLWHQGAHMSLLAAELRRRGVDTHAPTLHRGSLDADTAAVQAVVDACPSPPLVLGHSYGGAVITGLTGVRSLVYLAAFVPSTDESCASLGGALVNDAMRRDPGGGTFIDPRLARAALYVDADTRTADWAVDLLIAQAPGHGRGVPRRAAWEEVRSHYVVCSRDRAVDPDVQRALSRRCTDTTEMAADHSPYISRPEAVADIVMSELAAI
ncbi:alpha/beta hydrolase [Microbacterium sp. PMB16]|uniref:alpha/beta hydrolase n=1 Tax=Microbacterium sp. PMB16 TaxID=3120157 RepID=UPI003F4C36A5